MFSRMLVTSAKNLAAAGLLAVFPLILGAQEQAGPRQRIGRQEGRETTTTRPSRERTTLPRPAPAPAPGEPRPGSRPEVFFCDIPDTQCRTNIDTFSVEEIRDLFVFVTWPHLRGQHVQTLEFILPDGNLYQRIGSQFTARPDRPQPPGQPKARPEALPQRFLTTSRGVPTVGTVLPVAGTFITQRSLVGTWTLRILLDGELVTTAQFTLNREAQERRTLAPPSSLPVEPRPGKGTR